MKMPAFDGEHLSKVCRRYGISELSVFGSFARNEANADSDIDLIYVLSDGVRMGFALFDFEKDLQEVFGRPVDLLEKESIHYLLRDEVLNQAKRLYAA